MASTPATEIETLRDKIKSGERGGAEADRDLLVDFSDRLQLLGAEYSDHRHIKLLRHNTRMAEKVGENGEAVLAPALEDKEAAEEVVRWINATYDNPETNRDYRVAFRGFGKHVVDPQEADTDDNGIPLTLSWIPTKTPKSYDPSPNPAELFDWDDIEELTEAARSSRDKAMVNLMMDAGPRGGEFFDLEVGDITDAEHGLQLRIDGKTGQRTVTLIPSVPFVNRWLSDHPAGDDPSAPLWSKLHDPDPISRKRVYQLLKNLAERAGINPQRKPTTPTNFRKSNASWLARTGANASLIEERQGRKRGSKAVARYVADFGEDNEQSAYARIHGRDVDQDTPERRDTVECPRCEKENPPTEDACVWCGQGLDPQGVAEGERAEKQVREALASLDPETAEQLANTVELIDSSPELRAVFRSLEADGH